MTALAVADISRHVIQTNAPWATGYRWFRSFASGVSQLRIDVALPEQDIEQELDALHTRWFSRESHLDVPDGLHLPGHPLAFWTREADGEHFIYVVDPVQSRLAAYIVMSRLIELDRRADRHLRSPHAKVAGPYRRMGIVSTVYRWWLDSGRSLISGARQSPAAHQLWQSLARDYPTVYVSLKGKRVRALAPPVAANVRDDIDTRVVLLAKACSLEAFASR